jgi:glycosyltransferase involved in cell wall biosynthesis
VTARRYAFVSDAVAPFNAGGKETRLDEVTRHLAAAGHDVHVYTMQWWPGRRTWRRHGVTYHAISRHRPLYRGGRRSLRQAVSFGVATLRLLGARFDAVEVDQIPFFPLFSARLVCTLRRTPLVAAWHEVWDGGYWTGYLGVAGHLAHVVERLALRMPDVVISNSPHTTARLRAARPGLQVVTVPLGVDVAAARRAPVAAQRSDVIYTGRLLRHKNVDLLIRAVGVLRAERPGIRCLVVGEGPERAALEALTASLGLGDAVRFRDFTADRDDVLGLMKASGVLVLPSEREGFGLVVLEANACGLPVVTVQEPANAAADLVTDGVNGRVCAATPEEIACSVAALLPAASQGHRPPVDSQRLERHDWRAVARQVGDVLAAAGDGGRTTPGPAPAVHVASYFPPHLGGLENVAASVAEGVAARRPVTVLTSRCADAPRVERRGGLEVRRLAGTRLLRVPLLPTLLWHLLRAVPGAVTHVHIAHAYAPEMVWLACRLRRRPYVAHFHLDVDPSSRLGPVFLLYKRVVLGAVLRGAAKVITLSPDQAEFVRRRHRVRDADVVILPNAVRPEFFDAAVDRTSRSGPCRLLFVGRICRQKNVPRLLEALRSVTQPVELAIVGDGEDADEVARLRRRWSLDNVRLVGPARGDALRQWYRWADVFVMSSDTEGMPLVALEAMAAGLPLVATAVPGITDTVADAGLLVPPSARDLAAGIDRVARDAGLRRDLADRARRRARRHAWPEIVARLESVYDEVLAGAPPTS